VKDGGPPGPDQVHLWRIDLDGAPSEAPADVLDHTERTRCAALAQPRSRLRFAAAHGAMRVVLGRYLSVRPAALVLDYGRWGKPGLAERASGLRFSLSHSGSVALLAVTRCREVGVDVEFARGELDLQRFCGRWFPPDERDLVAAAGPEGGSQLFLRLWSRKEACVKAAGARLAHGLHLPVGTCPGPLLVRGTAPPLLGPWLVRDLDVPPGAAAAVALAGERPYRVVSYSWPQSLTFPHVNNGQLVEDGGQRDRPGSQRTPVRAGLP